MEIGDCGKVGLKGPLLTFYGKVYFMNEEDILQENGQIWRPEDYIKNRRVPLAEYTNYNIGYFKRFCNTTKVRQNKFEKLLNGFINESF